MNCPSCQSPRSRVLDSRPKSTTVYRRRSCLRCCCKWTTYELVRSLDKHGPQQRKPPKTELSGRQQDVLALRNRGGNGVPELTQQQVADQLGISKARVSQLEREGSMRLALREAQQREQS